MESERLKQNLAEVHDKIGEAAQRSGRNSDDVKLVGVSKYVDHETASALFKAGCCDLGESRPQQLCERAEVLADLGISWHMIGHLQRNKARRTLPYISWLHSGDSMRLLKYLNDVAGELHVSPSVLIEVNVSQDASKHGFAISDVEPLLPEMTRLTHLNMKGFMAMASRDSDDDQARQEFAMLRVHRDRWQDSIGNALDLKELSMGMSGDYTIAIEEGATMVRVGSALFA